MSNIGTLNQLNREEWLKNTLKKIPTGARILDAGAGEQQYKKFCTHLNYVSQDFAQYDGKGNNAGFQTGSWDQSKLDIISDITCIPEADGSFDAIMCVEVFEHLPEPIKAITEFNRLLKPGGYLVITAPFCSLTHFAPYHYYTGYTKYFYEKFLSENRFEITDIQVNGNYFEYLAQEERRVQSMAEKYAKIKFSILHWIIVKCNLIMLESFSKKDIGSNEVLNFGYQVLAIKK